MGSDSSPELLSVPNYSYLSQIKGSFDFRNLEQFREEAMLWPLAKKVRSWFFSIFSVSQVSLHFEIYKDYRPLQRFQTNLYLSMGQRECRQHDGENQKCPLLLRSSTHAAPCRSMHHVPNTGCHQKWIRMTFSFWEPAVQGLVYKTQGPLGHGQKIKGIYEEWLMRSGKALREGQIRAGPLRTEIMDLGKTFASK